MTTTYHIATVERQIEVAQRFGIDLIGVTLSSIQTAPTPLTDEQIADALRLLAAIPDEAGT